MALIPCGFRPFFRRSVLFHCSVIPVSGCFFALFAVFRSLSRAVQLVTFPRVPASHFPARSSWSLSRAFQLMPSPTEREGVGGGKGDGDAADAADLKCAVIFPGAYHFSIIFAIFRSADLNRRPEMGRDFLGFRPFPVFGHFPGVFSVSSVGRPEMSWKQNRWKRTSWAIFAAAFSLETKKLGDIRRRPEMSWKRVSAPAWSDLPFEGSLNSNSRASTSVACTASWVRALTMAKRAPAPAWPDLPFKRSATGTARVRRAQTELARPRKQSPCARIRKARLSAQAHVHVNTRRIGAGPGPTRRSRGARFRAGFQPGTGPGFRHGMELSKESDQNRTSEARPGAARVSEPVRWQ